MTIDHEKRAVSSVATGTVDLKQILDYFDRIVVENAMSYSKLVEVRQVVPKLDDSDMMALGARTSAYAVYDPRGPVAVVTTNPEVIAFAQRFMNLGGARRPMRLFGSVDEARAWLALAD